ncbi:hypothetical protein [Aliivibrio logei]|uniref:hypothetical protein n=1 Tax=Aliivibrio logei TaxID=688 RepID=UPI0035C88A37
MKHIHLLLGITALTFLAACSDSSSGSSSGGGAAPGTDSAVPAAEGVNGIKTSELSIPEGFTFSTEREVSITLSVASSQSERGFMSLYSEFKDGVVDHTSQFIITPMNDETEFQTSVMLPNHVDKIWVEVWYPSAVGHEITQSVDIVDNTINAIL